MIISLYSIIFLILLVTSSLLEIFFKKGFVWNNFFSLQIIIYALLLFFAFLELKKEPPSLKSIQRWWSNTPKSIHLLALCSFLLGLFWVAGEFKSRGVWGDEYSQFFYSAYDYFKNSVNVAAVQQQAPMDYQLSFLSCFIFGETVFAVRFFAMFSFLSLVTLSPYLLFSLFGHWSVSLFGTSLFLLNPFIVYYGAEGRPFMLGLFWAFLYCFRVFQVGMGHRPFSIVSIVLVGSLFTMSTGLQPIFLIASIFVGLFGFYSVDPNRQNNLRDVLISHFLMALFILPSVINIYIHSKSQNQFHKDYWGYLLDYFANYSFEDVFFFFHGWEGFFWVILPMSLVVAFLLVKKKKLLPSFIWWMSISMLFYILSLGAFFEAYINWNFYFRYVFSSLALAGLIFSYLFCYLFKNFRAKPMAFNLLAIAVTCYILIYNSQKTFHRLEVVREYLSFDPKIYEVLAADLRDTDILVKLNLARWGEWRDELWNANDFYMPIGKHPQMISKREVKEYLPEGEIHLGFIEKEKLENSKEARLIFVQSLQPFKDYEPYFEKLGLNFKVEKISENIIYKVEASPGQRGWVYSQVLESLLEIEEVSRLPSILEPLFYYYTHSGTPNDLIRIYDHLFDSYQHIDRDYRDVELSVREWAERIQFYRSYLLKRGIAADQLRDLKDIDLGDLKPFFEH